MEYVIHVFSIVCVAKPLLAFLSQLHLHCTQYSAMLTEPLVS